MLSPEQEKNWPAFEQAARDFGKLRLDRMNAMRNTPRTDDPAARLNQRASAMMETGIAMKKLAEATDPLYKSLDDSQKRRFAMLSRLGGPRMDGHGPRFRGRHHRDGDGPRHWGPRRTDGGPEGFDRPGEAAPVTVHKLAAAVALPAPRHDRRRTGSRRVPARRLFLFRRCRPRSIAGQPGSPLLHDARFRGLAATAIRAHSSVGRAADS